MHDSCINIFKNMFDIHHCVGTEGGLRLQLNIEQYQYMPGPNEGAGLKIQVHNANEIPLIRDHGLAVPPGHHGLVAIKTIQVNMVNEETQWNHLH